jgi:hypothetical protein
MRKNWLASAWNRWFGAGPLALDGAFQDIQHARINALPHLDNYQGRAVTN